MSTILSTTSTFNYKADKIRTNPFGRRLTESELKALIEEHQPVGLLAGVEPITRDVLNVASSLKTIVRVGVGMDNVDLDAAKEKGILVLNTPDAMTQPVAELTLGLILSLLRKIHMSHIGLTKGDWFRPKGNLLSGKKVGLIGSGRIGTRTGELCEAFGAKVSVYDPYAKDLKFDQIELNQLLKDSDIISLHTPLTDSTKNIISKDELNLMKSSSYLINASRGGLINEEDLLDVIKKKKINGVALDCFLEEPYKGQLVNLENVLLTAHIGGYAIEARSSMEEEAYNKLIDNL